MVYLRLLACAVSFVTLGGGFVMLNREHSNELSVSNGGQLGYWGTPEFCPLGTYASGYSMKIEATQFLGDDTALNAIRLLCSSKDGRRNATHQVSSSGGPYGTWTKEETCDQDFGQPSFMTSFRLQVEPQGAEMTLLQTTSISGVGITGQTLFYQYRLATVYGEHGASGPRVVLETNLSAGSIQKSKLVKAAMTTLL